MKQFDDEYGGFQRKQPRPPRDGQGQRKKQKPFKRTDRRNQELV